MKIPLNKLVHIDKKIRFSAVRRWSSYCIPLFGIVVPSENNGDVILTLFGLR